MDRLDVTRLLGDERLQFVSTEQIGGRRGTGGSCHVGIQILEAAEAEVTGEKKTGSF